MYEYGTLKAVKGILRRRRGKRENNEVYTVHIYKNVTMNHPIQLLCTNKMFNKRTLLYSSMNPPV
jgi:hypothetical protein